MTRFVRSRNRVTQAALFPGIPPLERTKVHKVARRQPIPKWVPYLLHGVPRSQRLGKNPSFPELDPGANSALALACQLAVTSPSLGHAGAQALSQIHLACGSSLPGAGRGPVSILPAGSAAVGAGGGVWAEISAWGFPGSVPSLPLYGFHFVPASGPLPPHPTRGSC